MKDIRQRRMCSFAIIISLHKCSKRLVESRRRQNRGDRPIQGPRQWRAPTKKSANHGNQRHRCAFTTSRRRRDFLTTETLQGTLFLLLELAYSIFAPDKNSKILLQLQLPPAFFFLANDDLFTVSYERNNDDYFRY